MPRSVRLRPCLVLPTALIIAASALGACSDESVNPVSVPTSSASGSGTGSGGAGGAAAEKWPNLQCDPLVPEVCAYPFPSNVFTVADESTPTGRRVSLLDGTLPQANQGYQPKGEPWTKSDGFSPGMAILAYLPDATDDGLPTPETLAASLEPGSPTVLLDAETGALVAHWAEIDHSTADLSQRALIIRPAVRLEDGRRYVVAIRAVTGAGGEAIPPSPAFKALRDGETFDADPSIEARRGLYEELFGLLDTAGVPKADLQLAWDFTTASRENNTGWLVHMRDEALMLAGDSGPAYTINLAEDNWNPMTVAYRIQGTMKVPFYLDQPDPGAALQFGADGLPEPNTAQPTYDVEWELIIPKSATAAAPAKLLQYGHGLLGSRSQIESDHFLTFMNQYNYAMFGVNMVGMAEDDENWIASRVLAGEVDELARMFDRLQQGILNNLMAMRMMSRGMGQDATYGELLDEDQRFYYGISQGGIMGGVYMALSTDVERGALEVMGQSYTVLLNRSVDFDPFFQVLTVALPDAREQQIFLGVTQMLWDRAEPNGFSKYIVNDRLPNTPEHKVLLRAALGDHQVTTYGAHVMARAIGATHLDTGLRDIWGLEKKTSPLTDAATYSEYDFGLPPEPLCNVPMNLCEDPHGKIRRLDEARAQLDHFFTTAEAVNLCTGGATADVCTHPELSGCVGGEDSSALCD